MLYTIGHSNQSIDRFCGLLTQAGIQVLYDVRSRPFSRFSPQFNRERLKVSLNEAGIDYVYIGDMLGGRPEDPCCYVDGKLSYDLQAQTLLFQQGLARLREEDRVAVVMCAERDPMNCHRTHSIAKNLPDMEIVHIMGDGRQVPHAPLNQPMLF